MKRLTFVLSGLVGLTLNTLAAEAPRGSLLELHSVEVFAGPCVVNSESVLNNHYMVRAWDFTGGSFQGTDLAGLQLAVLQSSSDNLAAENTQSGIAVVYLPQSATQPQRDALLAWVKSSQKDFRPANIQTRVVPLQFTKSEKGYAFTAGDFVTVKTASLKECAMGGCGEVLWYQPRTETSLFTVAVNSGSKVTEPLVNLKWTDTGVRSLFLARFGEPVPAKNLYVTIAELCGPTQKLF